MNRALLTFTAAAALATSALAQPAHYTQALQLVDEIQAAQDAGVYTDGAGTALNRYGGSWGSATDGSFIRFADIPQGVLPGNNTRCAPLVTHLLKYCYGWNWKSYTFLDPITGANKTSVSPYPYQYVALIKQQKGFAARITRLDQAQAGDVIAWWKVGSDQKDHAMLLSSVNWNSAKTYPTDQLDSDPSLAGTTYYEVEVIDSSSDLHANDSRLVNVNGVDTHLPGIGTGTIGLLVNANSEIVGFTWSLPTKNYATATNYWLLDLHKRLNRTPAWEAVIGRLP